MKILISFLKTLWKIVNFIRDIVMNVVFLIFVLLLLTVLSLMSTHKGNAKIDGDQGALIFNLDGYLSDNRDEQLDWKRTLKQQLQSERDPQQISTFDVVYAINMAKKDDRIKGIIFDLNYFEGADLPALNYIGSAIERFKATGKPVIALSDNYTQGQYLLASFADEIYLNSVGNVNIEGFAIQQLYYKSLLDKLAVTPYIFRVGTYKSAVEPFLRDNMSPAARSNMQRWLGTMWQHYQQTVSKNRRIDQDKLLPASQTYLAELKKLGGDSTAYVKQRHLVTQVANRFETTQNLIKLFGKDSDNLVKGIDFEDYLDVLPERMDAETQHKIAVVNVEGAIIDGESAEGEVGGDTVANLLRQAREDKEVYGVILRVNSPGGSAFASEIIRQEVDNLQQAGKPVVVSMGAMAASGGYWISSTADYIVADKDTITGSIGIFAMFPNFEKTLKKAGVSADGVSTTPFSQQSAFSELSPELKSLYQMEIEHGYDQFLNVVSRGRKLDKAQVDRIAQGQVWLGIEAYQHKLVDELGDLDTAYQRAMQLVNKQREQNGDSAFHDFSLQWITDEEHSLLSTLMHDLRKETKVSLQSSVREWIGLPKQVETMGKPFGLLSQFNDPKGQYLYCLNCAQIN